MIKGAVVFLIVSAVLAGGPVSADNVKDVARQAAVTQRMGEPLSLDASVVDESGRRRRLVEFFGQHPVLLTFVYFNCPMLCPLNLKGLARSVKMLPLVAGRDYELVVVSIDPHDEPAQALHRREMFAAAAKVEKKGVHFLTGTQEAISRITESAGFHFAKDDKTGQYAHPTVLVVATSEGRISRYLFGLDYAPRDLRLALADAHSRKIGSLSGAVLMYCFAYDPSKGRYTLAVLNLLKLAAFITVMVLILLIYLLKRREMPYDP